MDPSYAAYRSDQTIVDFGDATPAGGIDNLGFYDSSQYGSPGRISGCSFLHFFSPFFVVLNIHTHGSERFFHRMHSLKGSGGVSVYREELRCIRMRLH